MMIARGKRERMREVYGSREWRETVSISLIVLIALLLADFAFGVRGRGDLQAVEILSLSVLGSNLAMGYASSFDKPRFLRGHALELLVLVPLFGVLRLAEYDYALMRLLRVGAHAEWVSNGFGYAVDAMKYRLG